MAPQTSLTLLDRLKDPENLKDWEVFVELYQPIIAQRLVQYQIETHDAEDLAQDVLVVTFRALPSFEHNGRAGAFRAWLGNIIQNRALNFLRARGRLPIPESSLTGSKFDFVNRCSEDEERWQREHDEYLLSRALKLIEHEFTRSTWLAFQLQAIEGRTPQQSAELLGLSANAAMIAKSRVLSRLRAFCSGLVDDEHL